MRWRRYCCPWYHRPPFDVGFLRRKITKTKKKRFYSKYRLFQILKIIRESFESPLHFSRELDPAEQWRHERAIISIVTCKSSHLCSVVYTRCIFICCQLRVNVKVALTPTAGPPFIHVRVSSVVPVKPLLQPFQCMLIWNTMTVEIIDTRRNSAAVNNTYCRSNTYTRAWDIWCVEIQTQ